MLLYFIELLFLVIFASINQQKFKIPSPITIISIVLGASFLGFQFFSLHEKDFDNLVLITLPLLIASDALKLKYSEIKEHSFSLFYIAVIAVSASIAIGVLFNDYVLINYPLSIASVILLFSMVSATDPVTVSAVFSNFKVPHKLKLITEGESLFNDATALIIFSLALVALSDPAHITAEFIAIKSFLIIFGASAIGLILGFICVQFMKITDDALLEGAMLIFFAYLSYFITEHFHFSGILSIIVCILFAGSFISKQINTDHSLSEQAQKSKNWPGFSYAITNEQNHKTILKIVDFLALLASGALFASIASIVNFEKLFFYKWEILAVFIASTIIRALTMMKFAFVSSKISKMQNIKKHWLSILTFAGSKGALSILMVHMIPSSFEYKALFETIIIGVILLSTFIYAGILAIIFTTQKDIFNKECLEEKEH